MVDRDIKETHKNNKKARLESDLKCELLFEIVA